MKRHPSRLTAGDYITDANHGRVRVVRVLGPTADHSAWQVEVEDPDGRLLLRNYRNRGTVRVTGNTAQPELF